MRNRTRFQAGTTTSFNCAMDTFNNGVGVRRDFAHLTISLCRALNTAALRIRVDYMAQGKSGIKSSGRVRECRKANNIRWDVSVCLSGYD